MIHNSHVIDMKAECYMAHEEVHGDIAAQHMSETSMYGDSWPGAQIQIHEAWLAAQEAKRAYLLEAGPEINIYEDEPDYGFADMRRGPVLTDDDEEFDDIPF